MVKSFTKGILGTARCIERTYRFHFSFFIIRRISYFTHETPRPLRILIVDDSTALQKVTSRALKAAKKQGTVT
jgi:PleD family two-component response regulator